MLRRLSRRRFGSQVPWSETRDPKAWGSLLPSSKATADLTTLETRLAQRGVKYCLPAFVDMHGVPKTKLVPVDHVRSMCEGSELFTGAALDGVPQEVSDNEVCAVGDAALGGFPLPYRRDVAWFPASLWLDGKPFEACSRNIYARVAQRAKDRGYLMKLGIEAEFFVFQDDESKGQLVPVSPLPPLAKPCYDAGMTPFSSLPDLEKPAYDVGECFRLLDNLPWLDDLVDAMQELEWGVYSFDHEDGVGQVEIDFSFCEAGEMADRFVLLRTMANAVARK
ncbi:hypothetical protein CTAYLR_006451 [Chrysophaeum taylorii]|uniref:GS catalytic domain-containing protein n=1 Tax=Chrysophaeum taylorii TaxID=2483200 RepID=A0AAD7UMB4_9STRA|nr:hypothetical protein CTAYLR_006451 [Chrysophaeum taylorii]